MNWLLALLSPLALNFGTPATPEQIAEFEQQVGEVLPDDLRTIYQLFNGYTNDGAANSVLPFRMLSLQESLALQGGGKNWPGFPSGVQPFWTDDRSNYVLVYLSGPLRGMVILQDHDYPDPAPRYRNALSFLFHLYVAGTTDHYDDDKILTADFPVREQRLSGEQIASDRRLFQLCRTEYRQTDDLERHRAAFTAMNLLPYEDTSELEEFALDEDFYIAERACEIFGKRRWEEAEELLMSIAKDGHPNAAGAAQQALKQL